jgi:integrase
VGKLTTLKIKSLKEPGRHTDGSGLMLYIKEGGSKTWVFRPSINGKRRDFGLGSLGDVSLAEAREAADVMRRLIRQGVDPLQHKRQAKAATLEVVTFRAAARSAYTEHEAGWRNAKHRAQWLSSLEAYAFPDIGDRPVSDVDGPAIRDLLAKIWLSKPETARRVRQRIGTVLDWAYAKGLRSSEAPMRSLSRGLPRQPKKDNHFAALPYPDAPALMQKLGLSSTIGRLALRFLILTATRSGEVRLATWQEIDFKKALWTIPASRMKAGKEHVVPLSAAAMSILAITAEAYGLNDHAPLFPGKGGKPLSDMTLTKVLRTDLPGIVTVHGFRSSFRDWAAEQTAFPGEVVEAALAHAIANKVEAAYRRTNYLEKRTSLMTEWADYLQQTTSNATAKRDKSLPTSPRNGT